MSSDQYFDAQALSIRAALDWWAAAGGGPTSGITGGGAIRRLEQETSRRLEGRPCLAVASGTDALATALIGVGVVPGQAVICCSYDWPAATDAIRRVGATPIYVAPDPNTLTIDPAAAAQAVHDGTAALIATHLQGVPADVPALARIGIPIVEDASQGWGARLDGRYVGTLTNAAAFSLGPGKPIDAGEGGLTVFADHNCWLAAVAATQHPVRQVLAGLPPNGPSYSTRISPASAIIAAHLMATDDQGEAARKRWATLHHQLTADGWKILPAEAPERRQPVGDRLVGRPPTGAASRPLPDRWLSAATRPRWLSTVRTPQPDLRERMLQGRTGTPRADNPTVHTAAPVRAQPFPTHGGRQPRPLTSETPR